MRRHRGFYKRKYHDHRWSNRHTLPFRSNYTYRRGWTNEYGQSGWELRNLTARAIDKCKLALRYEARGLGFSRALLIGSPYAEQIGPHGFTVYGVASLRNLHGIKHEPYECIIRGGVVQRTFGLHNLRLIKRHGNIVYHSSP